MDEKVKNEFLNRLKNIDESTEVFRHYTGPNGELTRKLPKALWYCNICGCVINTFEVYPAYRVPLKYHGKPEVDNVIPLCKRCNRIYKIDSLQKFHPVSDFKKLNNVQLKNITVFMKDNTGEVSSVDFSSFLENDSLSITDGNLYYINSDTDTFIIPDYPVGKDDAYLYKSDNLTRIKAVTLLGYINLEKAGSHKIRPYFMRY